MNVIDAQNRLIPEMMELLHQRFELLSIIEIEGPVGRRPLSQRAGITERECRSALDGLRDNGLIRISKEGAAITADGADVLYSLRKNMEQWSGRDILAKRLRTHFGIRAVHIVAGDSDHNPSVKGMIGKEAAAIFTEKAQEAKIIAVTGGSSVAAVPSHIRPFEGSDKMEFIAARGGVGEDLGVQANVIASLFANAADASYSTFYYPEALSEEAHEVFKKEPAAKKMMALYDQTDCVIHGIGEAVPMAELRGASEKEIKELKEQGAIGEAFGYYFDSNGEVVHRLRTVGIQLTQLQRVPLILATAGGSSKAEAIAAYLCGAPKQTILLTDEACAENILSLFNKK